MLTVFSRIDELEDVDDGGTATPAVAVAAAAAGTNDSGEASEAALEEERDAAAAGDAGAVARAGATTGAVTTAAGGAGAGAGAGALSGEALAATPKRVRTSSRLLASQVWDAVEAMADGSAARPAAQPADSFLATPSLGHDKPPLPPYGVGVLTRLMEWLSALTDPRTQNQVRVYVCVVSIDCTRGY